MNTPPIKRSHICAFCGTGVTHVIDPATRTNDRYAKPVRTTHGLLWKCRNCIQKEHDDFLLKQAPNSPLARNILIKRRREIEDQKKRIASLMRFHKLSGEQI
jgi:hypothetical protein